MKGSYNEWNLQYCELDMFLYGLKDSWIHIYLSLAPQESVVFKISDSVYNWYGAWTIESISSKYNNTYSYIIWVDSKSKLILRANLINSRNLLLEEFRVLSTTILPPSDNDNENDKKLLVHDVNNEKHNSESFDWQSNWVPQGFQKFNSEEYRLKLNGKKVQVKMYTDHLFYFSIYFTHGESTQNVENRVVKLGPQIMESKNLNGNLVTVIGSLPLKTINKILKNVSSESTN